MTRWCSCWWTRAGSGRRRSPRIPSATGCCRPSAATRPRGRRAQAPGWQRTTCCCSARTVSGGRSPSASWCTASSPARSARRFPISWRSPKRGPETSAIISPSWRWPGARTRSPPPMPRRPSRNANPRPTCRTSPPPTSISCACPTRTSKERSPRSRRRCARTRRDEAERQAARRTAAGRRRQPYRGDRRCVCRGARRPRVAAVEEPAGRASGARFRRRGVGRDLPGRAGARSRLRRGCRLRHRHERRDDRRRPVRRAAGNRGGRAVLARRGGRASCAGGAGHRRIDRASASRARAVKLVLASNNPGKLREIGALLAPLSIELISQAQLGIGEAAEPHATFLENALAKARHASRAAGLPALGDDSGLCVEALAGEPGVHSACYARREGSREERDARNNEKILSNVKRDRKAYYCCVMVLLRHRDDPRPLVAEGIWRGEIARAPRGRNGFGYDPLFLLPERGLTAAELDPAEKNRISHRGQALARPLEP